jgi:hypothetical protein
VLVLGRDPGIADQHGRAPAGQQTR